MCPSYSSSAGRIAIPVHSSAVPGGLPQPNSTDRTIISFVQPQPNSIENKNNPIGCGTAPGNLVLEILSEDNNQQTWENNDHDKDV